MATLIQCPACMDTSLSMVSSMVGEGGLTTINSTKTDFKVYKMLAAKFQDSVQLWNSSWNVQFQD